MRNPSQNAGKNDWGLYGVGGNVWEVTEKPGSAGAFGASRGASWFLDARDYVRCSCRVGVGGTSPRRNGRGFRLLLSR